MKFKIKFNQIKGFAEFLLSLELAGAEGRMRTRLVKKLEEKLQEISTEFKEEILKKHCHLDEEGNPKIIEKNGQSYWDIKKEQLEEFNKEYADLWNEQYVIDGRNDQKILLSVRDSVLNCEKKFSGQDALVYDDWCALVEEMEED